MLVNTWDLVNVWDAENVSTHTGQIDLTLTVSGAQELITATGDVFTHNASTRVTFTVNGYQYGGQLFKIDTDFQSKTLYCNTRYYAID